jgi:hypothetical protein
VAQTGQDLGFTQELTLAFGGEFEALFDRAGGVECGVPPFID